MARNAQEVRIWNVQDRRKSKGYGARPFRVVWEVDGKRRQRMHRTKKEAENYRARLLVAQQMGERFDLEIGEPESWQEKNEIGCGEWIRRYLDEQWDEWQPRTRKSAIEEMSRFLPLLIKPGAPDRPELRTYLVTALWPGGERDDEMETFIAKWNYTLTELDRSILADVAHKLGFGLKGQLLAKDTAKRYRGKAHTCIKRAVDLELIERDPWPPEQRGAKNRKVRRQSKGAVDIRQLPDPQTMRDALDAIVNHQPASRMYFALTATMAYAGLRPSEAVMLRPRALTLPTEGWGRVEVTEADDGLDEPGDPKTGDRSVPIPPVLVEILRDWIQTEDRFADDELIFRTRNDNRPHQGNWGRAWHRALGKIDYPRLRIYDCRHTAATTWLRAGVPLAEVARRMGHSVETLVKTYIGALDGDEEASNTLIDAYLL